MRFKQFLSENTEKLSTFEKDMEHIRSACQPFLEESKGKMLWRGMPKIAISSSGVHEMDHSKMQKFTHPKDRAAKHTDKTINFFFNAGCEMAFGVKDIRKQALFASGNPVQAAAYGKPFIIFPIREFKYISSKHIPDSIDKFHIMSKTATKMGMHSNDVTKYFKNLADEMTPSTWVKKPDNALMADALSTTYSKLYQTSGLDAMITKGHEILIYKSSGYFAIPVSIILKEMKHPGHADVQDIDKKQITSFLNKYLRT